MKTTALLCTIALGIIFASPAARGEAGDIYESDLATGTIFQFTRNADNEVVKLTFRTGLTDVRGLAFDRSGNLFVGQSETITKITPGGATNVLASDLDGPNFLATDPAGNVYASDRGGHVVRITPLGEKSVYASDLGKPSGLAFDFAGDLFVADVRSNSIFRITPAGEKSTFVQGLNNPQALVFDRNGNLYVANQGTGTVEAFSPTGQRFTSVYNAVSPSGLAFDVADNFYVSQDCGGSDSIYEFTPPQTTGVLFAENLGCPVQLAVEPPRDALRNISTRARVQSENQRELIAGFIIEGDAPKTVLLRALGPSLEKPKPPMQAVANPLQDPRLELHGPDGTIETNDNWMDGPYHDEIQSSGLAPKDERESAILVTLDPGSYTAVVRGNGFKAEGIALMEVYDVDSTHSTLANISTRAFVQTKDDVMIGGFIIGGGNGAGKVIIRALGPSLEEEGVSNVLEDPTVQLLDANGTILDTNDDWADGDQSFEIYVSGIPPKSSLEAAIVATLPSGAYTAIVRGLDQQGAPNGTGVGLVEIYNLR